MRTTRAAVAAGALAASAGLASASAADASYEKLSMTVDDKHVLRGSRLKVHGRMRPKETARGRVVWVYAYGPGMGGWTKVAKPKTDRRGRYSASWRPPSIGRYDIRAILTGSDAPPRDGHATVYKESYASYYGPGLYGNRTACGQTLTRSTLGTAHRTLPCGTRVAFYNQGYHITVRVIDRGPFIGGREWDLTEATKDRLHFGSTGTLWSAPIG